MLRALRNMTPSGAAQRPARSDWSVDQHARHTAVSEFIFIEQFALKSNSSPESSQGTLALGHMRRLYPQVGSHSCVLMP